MTPDVEVLETYVTGYRRVRLPNGREGVQPGPELAERLAAAQEDRQRRASAAAEGLKLAARNDELAREVHALRSQPPEPAEVQRLRAELDHLRGGNLSLRAALDVMTSRVIELQNADMSRFPTPAHLASWAGRTPLDNSSGQRQGKAKAKKGNPYLAGITGETAIAAGRTQTREGARYRRIARRRGKAKALVAVGNTQMRVYHALLSSPGARYQDLGPDFYERQRDTRRQVAHHVGKLGALGFEVTLCRIPEPPPDEPATTPAA